MGCSGSRNHGVVEREIEARKEAPKPTGFDDLPQNGQVPVSRIAAGGQASASGAITSQGKYTPSTSKDALSSFVKLDDSDDDDEPDEPQTKPSQEATKLKLAEQFWATPTAEALRMRAPASGHSLSSQRVIHKIVDDLAFGISQDRRIAKPNDNGAAGVSTVNSLLHTKPRPQAREEYSQQAIPTCGNSTCVGLGFCVCDNPSKPGMQGMPGMPSSSLRGAAHGSGHGGVQDFSP